MTQEKTTTLAVSRRTAQRVRQQAKRAGLSMYEYVNRALDYVIDRVDFTVEAEEKGRLDGPNRTV